jgi:hypothetical protein
MLEIFGKQPQDVIDVKDGVPLQVPSFLPVPFLS